MSASVDTPRAAGVSEGNVTKVDQLRNAAPDVLKALHKGDVRIHRAWLWRKLNPELQQEQLTLPCLSGSVTNPRSLSFSKFV